VVGRGRLLPGSFAMLKDVQPTVTSGMDVGGEDDLLI
jgi:hypothetical protein